MDIEMIERCARAVRARDTQDEYAIVREVIKAMREPTSAIINIAGGSVAEIWIECIDTIIGDLPDASQEHSLGSLGDQG